MFSSIRVKLTLWYTVVLTLVIIVFSTLIYFSFVSVLRAETDSNLAEMANNFVVAANAEQGDEEPNPRTSENINDAMDAFRFRDYQFVALSNLGEVVAKTVDYDLPRGPKSGDGAFVDHTFNGEQYRVFDRAFSVSGQRFHLFVFYPLADRQALERRLQTIVLVAIPVALLLAGFGGYFLVRRSLRPVQQMSERASLITSQNLHERLPVANKNDELGNLATVFNALLDRLDRSFEQQRRFMADASHELRTPLAIVRGESEVAISKDTRTAADYQESLAIVHDESKRLTRIVEDLFTLARADAGNFAANFSDVYLDEIAAECVHSIRTLAEKQNIKIVITTEETPVKADESLLRRLVLNLLDNAVKYNNEVGKITVEVKDHHLLVTNTGPEIPLDERSEIFERFYRADRSRGRQDASSTSGAGLGLSISKWIAELHGATLELTRSHDGENTFVVTFPR